MKRKRGRPVSMDDKVIRKLEDAFSLGCTDLEACLLAGISKTTLYDYQQKHKDFTDRKEILKNKPILRARTSVVNSIDENPELALKYLERKCKSEFSLRTEQHGSMQLQVVRRVDMTGKGEEAKENSVDVDAKELEKEND